MVICVEPFFHGQGTHIAGLPLITPRHGKVSIQRRKIQLPVTGGNGIHKNSGVKHTVIKRKIVAGNKINPGGTLLRYVAGTQIPRTGFKLL